MFILGISCYYHDAAAALIQDGKLVAAAEEERFTRKKHDFDFPHHAIEFCLRQAGITGQGLDYVVFYEKPLLKFERSFHVSPQHTYNGRFVDLFGPPRVRESEFFTPKTHPERDGAQARQNQHYADIAASIQRATEEVLLRMANYAYECTGFKQLCMAGGVALNSVANGRILRETPFEDVFIPPAAGDSGGALGAALCLPRTPGATAPIRPGTRLLGSRIFRGRNTLCPG